MLSIIISLVWALLSFMIYLEIHPRLGKIWIRPNDTGHAFFSFPSLWNITTLPIYDPTLWCWVNLDLNIFVWWLGSFLFYLFLQFLF